MMWVYDLDLWPWCMTTIVGHTPPGTLSDYQMQILVILQLFVFDLWAIGPTWLRLITWPCDLDLSGHGACGWCRSSSFICIPSLKLVGVAIRKIWRTMCVCINGPGDPDLWPFDFETGMWVASKVRNLPNLGMLGLWVLELFAMYATDGQTDGQKQRLLPPSLRGRGNNNLTYGYANTNIRFWQKSCFIRLAVVN